MYFDMAGIDHQPFKVCVIHQGFQDPFPDSLVTPPAKPAVYILPVSIRFRQVTPRSSGAQNPEYTVDKLPGITGIPSLCPLFANSVWSDFLPRSVADIVPMLFHCYFLPSFYYFEDYYITFLLTTLSRNEKYMDNTLLQKMRTADFLTKTRLKSSSEVWQYYIRDDHDAIIPREIFYAVHQEKKRRAERHNPTITRRAKEKGYSSKYILSNLLACGECGQPYHRLTWTRNGEKRIVWRCASWAEHGTRYCQYLATLDEEPL